MISPDEVAGRNHPFFINEEGWAFRFGNGLSTSQTNSKTADHKQHSERLAAVLRSPLPQCDTMESAGHWDGRRTHCDRLATSQLKAIFVRGSSFQGNPLYQAWYTKICGMLLLPQSS